MKVLKYILANFYAAHKLHIPKNKCNDSKCRHGPKYTNAIFSTGQNQHGLRAYINSILNVWQ